MPNLHWRNINAAGGAFYAVPRAKRPDSLTMLQRQPGGQAEYPPRRGEGSVYNSLSRSRDQAQETYASDTAVVDQTDFLIDEDDRPEYSLRQNPTESPSASCSVQGSSLTSCRGQTLLTTCDISTNPTTPEPSQCATPSFHSN